MSCPHPTRAWYLRDRDSRDVLFAGLRSALHVVDLKNWNLPADMDMGRLRSHPQVTLRECQRAWLRLVHNVNQAAAVDEEGASDQPALREGVPEYVEEELRRWIFRTRVTVFRSGKARAHPARAHTSCGVPAPVCPGTGGDPGRAGQAGRRTRSCYARVAGEAAPRPADGSSAPVILMSVMAPVRRIARSPADPYARFLSVGIEASMLWDVADDLLHALCSEPLPPGAGVFATLGNRAEAKRTSQITEPLARLLAESRSVYEIRPDLRGLQRRIGAVLASTADHAVSLAVAAGCLAAGAYLAKARDRLFALHPDPGAAYVDMIRAVEAVACPLFLPGDPSPTLGQVRAHLRDAAGTYEYVLPGKDRAGGIDGVIAMITDLWEGHSDRHAGGPSYVQVSQEAALAAFTLTVSLVTLFSSGAVSRRGGRSRRPDPRVHGICQFVRSPLRE